jgi:hypothetical protein
MLWLDSFLRALHPSWQIEVADTSRLRLSVFIRKANLGANFPQSHSWDIQVPITAILRRRKKAELVLANCQAGRIALKDVGPFLVQSRLVLPALAVLLSPCGLSSPLKKLLINYKRQEVLDYAIGKKMTLGTWDSGRKRADLVTIERYGGPA